MAAPGETLRLGEGQSLEVLEDQPDRAVVVSTWSPHGAPGPSHVHPEQVEEFEVLEGVLTVEQDGVPARVHAAGETFVVPRGVAHRMWNDSDGPTRARWQVTPGLGTLDMWRRLDRGGPLAKPTVLLRHRRELRLRRVQP